MIKTAKELLRLADDAADMLSDAGLHAFDAYVRASASTSAEVKGQKLDAFEESSAWGIGVRALTIDGRMGFSYASGSLDAVTAAARSAARNALSAEPDEHNNMPAPPDGGYPEVGGHDPSIAALTEAQKISRAMAIEDAALGYDPRIKRVRKSSASFTESAWAITSSTGIRASATSTLFTCGIMVVAEDGGGSQMGYDFDHSRSSSGIDYEAVGRGAAKNAVGLLGATKPPSGMFSVMLDNLVSAEFLGVLAASFSAEGVLKGKSMLTGRVGEAICSGIINICDDSLLQGGISTHPFDDEGQPSQKTQLVADGVLKGFLHNAYTAHRYGAATTANARRGGFRTQPGVGATNLYIEPGDTAPEGLIGAVSEGLLVRELLGMHTANPITGDFSVGVSGHWISGGKPDRPVREAAISGNILEIFKGVEAVGSDLRFRGSLGAPSMLLGPLSVSGA